MKKPKTTQPVVIDEAVSQLQEQLNEVSDRWKRAMADYQNLQKRVEQERNDFVRFAAKNFISKLLTVVDDLEKAHEHIKDQGLELALRKLHQILKDEGVEKFEVLGKDYDIHTMEAITSVEGEEDNKVVAELRSGYRMHGAVLRPAQVAVSQKRTK